MGSGKKIVNGIAWTVVLNIVNGVWGFITVPILIAYLGKANYGLVGLAMSVNAYLRLMDLGFNSTNVRFFSNWLTKREFNKVNRLFQTSMSFYGTIGLINAIVLLIVSFFSSSIFNVTPEQDVIVKHLFYILAISAFISWYTSCFEQIIAANELVGWVKRLYFLPKLLQIVILILTVTLHFTIEWYYALTTFSMFVLIPFMYKKIRILYPFVSFKPSFDKRIFKEVIGYSLNLFSFGIFQFSVIHLRPLFLGIESTPESITDYQVLNGMIGIVLTLGGAFIGVVLPSASKVVASGDKVAQDRIAYKGTKYISITLCFCCFGMMSIAPQLLTAYVGESYLYLTYWLDLWLLSTLVAHNQAVSSLILAGSDVRAITYSTLSATIIGLLLCWFLIPIFDVGGTVIGYVAYCLVQILFYYLYYWPKVIKISSKRIFRHSFAPFAIVGLIICIGLRFAPLSLGAWPSIFIKGAAFAIVYFVWVYFILDKEDKAFIFGLIKR